MYQLYNITEDNKEENQITEIKFNCLYKFTYKYVSSWRDTFNNVQFYFRIKRNECKEDKFVK